MSWLRHIDTIDPDIYVQVGFQIWRAQDLFGEPDVRVQLKGACVGDERDRKQSSGTRGL